MTELEAIGDLKADMPEGMAEVLAAPEVQAAIDRSLGDGARHIVAKATVNIGVLRGGLKINMMPDECIVEADIRVPPGIPRDRVRALVQEILARHPEATMEERTDHSYDASWCDPHGEMAGIIQGNVLALKDSGPSRSSAWAGRTGATGAGAASPPTSTAPPRTMGRRDEHVTIDELMHIVRTHTLSAYDYLTR